MTPEAQARQVIDQKLEQAGWIIQDLKQLNLGAGPGVAVREYPTDSGPADYVLFVGHNAVGVIEAKRDSAGENITAHETQTERYATANLKWCKDNTPLRFLFEATGQLIRFTDNLDPTPRSRELFYFYRPEHLADFLAHPKTLRGRLKYIFKSLGEWVAQLYVRQGRDHTRIWIEEWASNLIFYRDLLIQFSSSLRKDYFLRYSLGANNVKCMRCDRAQYALKYILDRAVSDSTRAHKILISECSAKDHDDALQLYSAAEQIINNAINQLYFGSGAYKKSTKSEPGLCNIDVMSNFFYDYEEIFHLVERTHETSTIHHLIELYEFLIPGNPVGVFNAFRRILLGRAKDESYHYESLGESAIIRIVYVFIADYRAIFDNDDCRTGLVAILQLFAEAGWPDALKLIYDLPDMLR